VSGITAIGATPFSREKMLARLEEFSRVYAERPIKDNAGGMLSQHMFFTWFALQTLKPRAVVESGIWHGQGTWLIERTCPDADLYCIDINLERIEYRSPRAKYFYRDFSTLDWTALPKDDTLLFFDDHQNAYERIKQARWFGFKHMIFEDNYPAFHGDCYSLKKAFAHAGLQFDPSHVHSLKLKYKHWKRRILAALGRMERVRANDVDAKYLRENLEIYFEFPPVLKVAETRFGVPWDEQNCPTSKPLLDSVERDYQRMFLEDAKSYTWLCYARLK